MFPAGTESRRGWGWGEGVVYLLFDPVSRLGIREFVERVRNYFKIDVSIALINFKLYVHCKIYYFEEEYNWTDIINEILEIIMNIKKIYKIIYNIQYQIVLIYP